MPVNTPAHLIFGGASFGRRDRPSATWAALAGAAAPDLSLYMMTAVSIWGLGVPAQTVFREYYYSDAWQSVFAIDNSFILWGILFVVAMARHWTLVVAFSGAALLHVALDFPLHNHDARRHFWPVSDWVFRSPFSYWDRSRHAGIIGPIEIGMSMLLAAWCLVRFPQWRIRAVVCALAVAELSATGLWRFLF